MKCSISVLTIVKARPYALANLIKALELSSVLPRELIIIHMNEPVGEFRSELFSVKSFSLFSELPLPLAAARNYAAKYSDSSHLIFIAVDCIPASDLVEQYADGFARKDQLWTGPVRYLRKGAASLPDFFNQLDLLSDPDPIRGNLDNMSYELFWLLNFGCSRVVYEQVGGFDISYQGYGAEDTDFAFSARLHQVPIGVVPAVAYHQYHPSYDPPLNHLQDIIRNAAVFYKKWNLWPMEGWLKKFTALGLIEWQAGHIQIIREPSQTEIDLSLKR